MQRFFTKLSPSAQQFYTLSSPVAPSGDYNVSIDFSAPSGGSSSRTILDGAVVDNNAIVLRVNSNGTLTCFVQIGSSNQGTATTSGNYKDGKLHTALLSYVGSTLTLTVDGADSSSFSYTTNGAPNIGTIGARGAGNRDFFDGYLANLKITDGSTLVVDMPLDENFANTIIADNKETVLGSEEVANGDFSNGLAGWSVQGGSNAEVVNGELTCDTSGGNAVVTQNIATVIGATYILYCTLRRSTANPFISARAADNTELFFDSTSSTTNVTKPNTFTAQSTSTSVICSTSGGAGVAFWDDITIKEIPAETPLATTNQISASRLFTEDDALGFLGVNNWADPAGAIGTQWTYNGSGSYSMIGNGDFNQLREDNTQGVGDSLVVTFNCDAISGEMRAATSNNIGLFNTVGPKEFLGVADGVDLYFSRNSGVVSCTISDISVKERLEVAS